MGSKNAAVPPMRCAENRTAAPEDSLKSILDFDEGRMGVRIRRDRLLLPDGMSFDSWRELGRRVTLVVNSSAWWLGDWLVYGEQAYGDRYKQAIADTSLSYQTLRNYAWIARTFPVSRRRDTLSFGHHVEVAALSEEDQDVWLARAEQLHWSCSNLRRALRAEQLANRQEPGEETMPTKAFKIEVLTERHERWESAAAKKNSSVAEWIIETLDYVASQELRE